ncbi:AAA family ATPase [Spirosoma endbachense]|uniref:ORC1/DEAH AAA+ ATPase domain-containing protein n=1 Tax=Spirosoma endbachense TaxID=2666025 RepID=A0A6P1WBA4_9BACT|nr:AAA family ATPase [Spirosoma endbachense]QHW01047.1 hypothetical protein GJR95_41125 [Spirosoma endbachense]
MNTSQVNFTKALVSGVGYCLTHEETIKRLIPGASLATTLGMGLINNLAPGWMQQFAGELDYQKLRDQFADPLKLNHDLENLLRDAAVRSIRFIRNLYLEHLGDIHDLSFTETYFRQNPLKRAKEVLDTMEGDLAHWIKEEPIQQNLLEDPAPCLANITNYLFLVSGIDEMEAEWQELRTFFTEKLPICFELAFKEALKNDKNQKGFKAFQIWILTDMRQLLIKNGEVQAKILAEIKILKTGQDGRSTPTLKTYSEETAELKQLLEQNHKEVIHLLKKIISVLIRRSHSPAIPHFLNNLPPLGVDCIGRETELVDLKEKLVTAQRVVLLSGLGGLGKTTVAKRYVHLHQHEYRHLVWVELKGFDSPDPTRLPLRDAFVFDPILAKNLKVERVTDLEEFFMMLMNALRNLPGTNLLVIDNAGLDLKQRTLRDQLPNPPNWHVLITSRQNLPGFDMVSLDKLGPKAARELFNKYYSHG